MEWALLSEIQMPNWHFQLWPEKRLILPSGHLVHLFSKYHMVSKQVFILSVSSPFLGPHLTQFDLDFPPVEDRVQFLLPL